MPAIKAILAGMSKATVPPILIHTSGTGVLIMIKDHPGESPPPEYKIYNDMDIAHIESLAPTQPHRDVDLEIVAAAEKFRLKTHIVLPCTIYGIASGPVFSRGIANPHSIQTPNLIRAALDRKKAGTVGQGLNHWPNVHVDDCADGFIVILEKALEGKTATGREGYYFLENGEYIFRDVAAEIGRVLKCLGKAETDEVTPFSDEEVQKYFGSPYLGSNSRCRAERARALGWTPKKTTEDYIASIRPEIEALIVRDQGKGFVARPDGVVAQEEARK